MPKIESKINIYQYYSGLITLINQKKVERKKYKQKVIEDLYKQPNQTKIIGDYEYSIKHPYNKYIVNTTKLKQEYPEVYKQCIKLCTIGSSVIRKRIK